MRDASGQARRLFLEDQAIFLSSKGSGGGKRPPLLLYWSNSSPLVPGNRVFNPIRSLPSDTNECALRVKFLRL